MLIGLNYEIITMAWNQKCSLNGLEALLLDETLFKSSEV